MQYLDLCGILVSQVKMVYWIEIGILKHTVIQSQAQNRKLLLAKLFLQWWIQMGLGGLA